MIRKNAVDAAALERIRAGLLTSPLMGKSTLAGSFQGSYGFAVTFTVAGRSQLIARYPAIDEALAALIPPTELCPSPPNAWFLNLLKLPAGKGVGRHTDGTLRRLSGDPSAFPSVVSVLYLSVPAGGGGALELFRGSDRIAQVEPEVGAALHFDGTMEHAVLPAKDRDDGAERVSLVLEQYFLGAEPLSRLPEFRLDSRAGFAAYLADHASRPPGKMDLE